MKSTAAILLSRQPLRPCAQTGWVKKVVDAVAWIKENNLQLLTSVGMQTWELQIAAALREKLSFTCIVPAPDREMFEKKSIYVQQQFDLFRKPVRIVPLVPEGIGQEIQSLPALRDRALVAEADILVPVSIRTRGGMEQLLHRSAESGKPVIDRFRIEYEKRTGPVHYHVQGSHVSESIVQCDIPYSIHWTRSSNTAWPTERKLDYYNDILDSERYPRSAFFSLRNILEYKLICATSKHMQDKIPTVSFSDIPPVEIIPLMRWRARYRMMSFEPYGIGIKKEHALKLGIKPVIYYSRKNVPSVEKENHYLLQSRGEITDWRQEREYRFKGDFGLHAISKKYLACFCYTASEARAIEKDFGVQAYGFID
ncbi:MAG: hypothetical protein GF350_15935 [Chitinivibrionales bacterium]|nr:hypothetical protein [Chitinivibrionales bacterium]